LGHFYLFFTRSLDFFIAILYRLVKMITNRGDMNKLHLQHPLAYQADAESVVSIFPPDPVYPSLEAPRRLVVLVPMEADSTAAMPRIWELAHTLKSQILFLGLCSEETQETSLRRQLITLCAMARDGKVQAEGRVESGSNWVRAAQSHVREGDMIVCFDEQHSRPTRRPFSQVLESSLHTPVYLLSGLSRPAQDSSNWPALMAAWVGYLAIVAGAFLLQVQIVTQTTSWIQNSFLIGSVLAELWLIWIWNRLFR
jgi:hypothetical protein